MRGLRCLAWTLICCWALGSIPAVAEPWKPGPTPLMTRWGRALTPENVWPEYPRPQLERGQWQNLNGLWDYAILARDASAPTEFAGQILVPFCAESALSGVTKSVLPDQTLWYRREIELEKPAADRQILLHFQAVDWETTVFVNGQQVGEHRGGSDPFTINITAALRAGSKQELLVRVWDPTDQGPQPRGKQVLEPKGIWYTPVTGIWQSVWLENVPTTHVERLRAATDISNGNVSLKIQIASPTPQDTVQATVTLNGTPVAQGTAAAGEDVKLQIADRKLWSPSTPTLYDVQVQLLRNGQSLDAVSSYFAFRKISAARDAQGVLRMMLNDEPLFQYGPLDQGWWPDGLLTPPSDEAMAYDLQVLKSLGMNMLRKHIKVEPARLYYHCDRLGLIVWQDMPSAMQEGRNHFVADNAPADGEFTDAEKAQFRHELQAMIHHLDFFPCIAVWVPFNEGWGQHDTNEVLKWVEGLDPTRLVNGPSGWTDRGYGDMKDMHQYPGPGMFPIMEERVSVLGEFGGLGWPVTGHLWKTADNWGYRTYKTQQELWDNYEQLMRRLLPLVGNGLAAAVYTQTTDVEIEVNGLMTYDRELVKIPAEKFAAWHRKLTGPTPQVQTLLPDARTRAGIWNYTTKQPPANWNVPEADASSWQEGPGGFGTAETPGAQIGTTWSTSDLWARRRFELSEVPRGDVYLTIHHDEDAEVYVNGVLAAELKGYTSNYTTIPLSDAAKQSLRAGENHVAVHCHQTNGGQYIDLGILLLKSSGSDK